jgi:hypothetical protein
MGGIRDDESHELKVILVVYYPMQFFGAILQNSFSSFSLSLKLSLLRNYSS